MLKISVVILRYKKLEDTIASVKSVLKQNYKDKEVVVVDDASPDKTYEQLKEMFPTVVVIKNEKPLGRSAHNVGLRAARGDILIPIDADMQMPQGFLEKVADKFNRNPKISFIAPNLIHPTDKNYIWPPVYDTERQKNGGYDCAGGLPFMRKEAFEVVGGFNPDIFLYVDEWEHLIRIWQADYRVIYFPDLVMYHTYSPNSYRPMMMGYHTVKNHLQLYAMYLPVRVWGKIIRHHTGQFGEVMAKGTANRWGTIKGVVVGSVFFMRGLTKRKVVNDKTLELFMKYYLPERGKVIVDKWGWI